MYIIVGSSVFDQSQTYNRHTCTYGKLNNACFAIFQSFIKFKRECP